MKRIRPCDASVLITLLFITLPCVLNAATLVVANKAEATVSLIDLGSGEVVRTLPAGDGPHEVGISPDGRFALVSNYGRRGEGGDSLTLIDVRMAEVVKTIPLAPYSRPHGVEWIDERHAAVTVEADRALAVVDVESGEVVSAIDTDQDVSHMVALGPGGQRAYVANIGSGSITVIDLDEGKRIRNIATGEGAEGVAVSASGDHIWVTNRADGTVTVLDADTLEIIRQVSSPGFPIRATATLKGEVLVTRAEAGDVVIYDNATLEETRTVSFDLTSMGDTGERLFTDRFGDSSVPIGVVIDDSGNRAYVAHANADVITEVDTTTGAITRMLRAGKEPDGMGFSAVDVSVD
jgi:YVTN family beta-propeller protein